jgi:8-oxo-dGTP diphosphatase
MSPVVGVGAFVLDGPRVLVIQRGRPPAEGLWSVPGGRVEGGETLAQALAREVREETGLAVEVGPFVCVIERFDHQHDFHFVILDYLARVVGGELAAGTDARAARWVTDAELAALPTTEGLLDVLARARAIRRPW